MLMLLFHGGGDRYALEYHHILTIIPMVELAQLRQAPHYIAGLISYHQRLVPVVDLCRLLHDRQAVNHLSTRIILVEYSAQDQPQVLGLLAEKVTETVKLDPTTFGQSDVAIDAQGAIRQVRLDRLVSKLNTQFLLTGDASPY